jgi:hypothetical protein
MTTKPTYDPARTGLLFVDPYNDFRSEGGKLWPRVKEIAEPCPIAGHACSTI